MHSRVVLSLVASLLAASAAAAGAQTGSQSGAQPGAQSPIQSGAQNGSQVGSQPGSQTAPSPAAPAQATPQTSSGQAGQAPASQPAPAPTPGSGYAAPAVPNGQPTPAQAAPAMPAYGQQPTQPAQVPAPSAAPGPAPVPAAPAPDRPYVAMPAYAGSAPYTPYGVPDEDRKPDHDGSVYIPLDSWIYPQMTRLYSLGYADPAVLAMRPWTRKTVLRLLQANEDEIRNGDSEEAKAIFAVVMREMSIEENDGVHARGLVYGTEQVYTRVMAIQGTTLRDSYHIGQTINNDYGRPYQRGFNNITGAAYTAEYGRFSLYVRGEYQHAPPGDGYSFGLSQQLSTIDAIPFSGPNLNQATIPTGPIAAQNPFRLVQATLSFHLLGHEISGGKQDAWLGPAQGGAMAWSNNAENIYSFRINRIEPLHIPLVSRILGPIQYDFFYGSLKGHTAPNSPYVHSAMFSFKPTSNFEFAFQRTVIFGGKNHVPVTIHSFLKSFFDINDTTLQEKYSGNDPGARFSDFSMAYRLPYLRKYVTFYVDSIAHDDVTPPSAPRRAAYRTGLYLSQFPFARKLDFRVEAVSTDPGVSRSMLGQFNYFEGIQLQGYTNKGYIMGDWIGREAKGGQAWLTYHISGNEWLQIEYLNKKTPKDFIPGGTTQNQFQAELVKRFAHDAFELDAKFQHETWKAPVYLTGEHNNNITSFQVRYFPQLKQRQVH